MISKRAQQRGPIVGDLDLLAIYFEFDHGKLVHRARLRNNVYVWVSARQEHERLVGAWEQCCDIIG